MTASCTFASGREYADFIDLSRLGAVVTKGVSPVAWAGNESPRVAETSGGMLNSIGLQNPGVEAFCAGDLVWLGSQDVPVVVNVCGHCADDYVRVVERLEAEPTSRVRTWTGAGWPSGRRAARRRRSPRPCEP